MNFNFLPLHSIKSKLTLFTLTIFVLSIWILAFYASRTLREDTQRMLAVQQFSAASFMAAEVNHELEDRLESLQDFARDINPAMLESTVTTQAYLEHLTTLQKAFNGGIFTTRIDGTATASIPTSAQRAGINYMERDHVAAALKEGKSTISKPVIGKALNSPVVSMAAPILDTQGKVIGALVGVTDLGKPNFLDALIDSKYGESGGYLIVSKTHRLIVTATNKRRVLEPSPAPGINANIDRYMQGFEGTNVFTNPLGVEVLQSVKSVPVANWYLAAQLPTTEAFLPIVDMEQRILLAATILTLLAGGLTWWMLRRQLTPIFSTLKTLAKLTDTNLQPQALPITSQDEIGELIGGFNRLLDTLGKREDALKTSRANLLAIIDATPIPLALNDNSGNITFLNLAFTQILGYTMNDITTLADWWPRAYPDPQYRQWVADQWQKNLAEAKLNNAPFKPMELNIRCKDDSVRIFMVSAGAMMQDVSQNHLVILYDITDHKNAEKSLQVSKELYQRLAEDMPLFITTFLPDGTLTYANEALATSVSMTPAQLVGKSFYEFLSIEDRATVKEQLAKLTPEQPIESHEQHYQGQEGKEIFHRWTNRAFFDVDGSITSFQAVGEDITARKQTEDEIRNLAFYDTLTKLPNRRLLMDRLHLSMLVSARTQNYGAVLFLDLDRFKTINDTLGHDCGDLLLIEVARRIQSCVREIDTVARLGGDEFVILLDGIDAHAEAASQTVALIAEKVRASLTAPYQIKGNEQHSSTSIGICLYLGYTESADALLKHADMAMYQAKDSGRNTVRFFDPAMQLAVETRAALEADLRRAVPDQQLHLYYQIQVDNDLRPVGAESLIRWIHPTRGMVSPMQFIPIAEESLLILDIGDWVLETACRQLKQWAKSEKTQSLTLAVNVSAQQFKQHDFVDKIATLLRIHNVEPSRLKLELTESVVLNDVADVITKMHALKALGAQLSMDDFGTGYSSLSYLKKLPLDQLKIDQSFVRDIATDPNDAVMVKTIINMGQNFRLNVIAEGVETDIQLGFLRAHGCMAYQGYYFSKPVPIAQFEALLDQA